MQWYSYLNNKHSDVIVLWYSVADTIQIITAMICIPVSMWFSVAAGDCYWDIFPLYCSNNSALILLNNGRFHISHIYLLANVPNQNQLNLTGDFDFHSL